MDYAESVAIMVFVIQKVVPFLVVVTISIALVKIVLKALKGRL